MAPDAATLQDFVDRMFDSDIHYEYRVTALFLILPEWLRYLVDQQLLDETQCVKLEADLRTLRARVKKRLVDADWDAALAAML